MGYIMRYISKRMRYTPYFWRFSVTIETKSAFAARLHVNRSTVTRWAQAGRLVLTRRGRVNVEESIALLEATKGDRLDVAARHAAARPAQEPAIPAADAQAVYSEDQHEDDAHTASQPEGLAKYKAMLLAIENQQTRLDMAIARRLRYHIDQVEREAQAIGSTVRAALERFADQTAPRLAVAADQAERKRIMEAEARDLRRLINAEFPRAMRRLNERAIGH